MEDTFFVVVNWNGAGLLPACLAALGAQARRAPVVVVDNGSRDDSREVARRAGAAWLPLGRNLGFAGGANAGLRFALARGARFAALVNTDAVLEPGWLACLRAAADARPGAGLFNGLLLFEGDPPRVNSTGLVFDWLLRARDRDAGVPLASLRREDGPVAGATGGALLLRLAALRRIGLFDPALFCYAEDADLSLRAARHGVLSWYAAGARGRHRCGATAGVGSPFQRRMLGRNHARVAARHLPAPLAAASVPLLAAARAGWAVPRELWRGRPAHARAQWEAAREGLWLGAGALGSRLRGREVPVGAEAAPDARDARDYPRSSR